MRADLEALIEREVKHAWAAGVLDAQGRWFVLRRGDSRGLSPRILVPARVDNPLIAQLLDLFGGSLGKPKGWQRQWQVTGAKACLAVTEAVLPYLTRTERVAAAHYRLCERIVSFKPASFHDRAIPADEIKMRESMVSALAKEHTAIKLSQPKR